MLLFQGKVCPELGTTLPKLVLLVWKYVMKDFKIRPGSALDNLTWLTYSGQGLAAGCGWGAIRREAMMEPGQYWTVNGDGKD